MMMGIASHLGDALGQLWGRLFIAQPQPQPPATSISISRLDLGMEFKQKDIITRWK